MEKRYWHGLDQWVNPMGFGCWQLAGEYYVNGKPHGWGHIEETEAIKLVHFALDNGLQFFDTALSYGNGRSEELLGKAFSTTSLSHNAVICTKIPLEKEECTTLSLGSDFVEKVENALVRLKRERLDVLLFHNPPDDLNWREFDTNVITKLQKEGKIGIYGVSSKSLNGAIHVADSNFGSCIEWVLNLLERRPIEQIFPKIGKANMNFIARSPLSRGLLSQRFIHKDPLFTENDFRSTLPADWVNWVIKSIRDLNLTSEEAGNLSNLALGYCLKFKEVSAVIPGIKTTKQLADYLALNQGDLTEYFLTRLYEQTAKSFPGWD